MYAQALVEHAETLVARLLRIAESGDDSEALRAIEQLTSRVLGKPKESVEQLVPPDDFRKVREMSAEQREALYRRLIAAEQGDPPPMQA